LPEGKDRIDAVTKAKVSLYLNGKNAKRAWQEGRGDIVQKESFAISDRGYEDKRKYDQELAGAEYQAIDAAERDKVRSALAQIKVQLERGELTLTEYFDGERTAIKTHFDNIIKAAKKSVDIAIPATKERTMAEDKHSQTQSDQTEQISNVDSREIEAKRKMQETILNMDKTIAMTQEQTMNAKVNRDADWRDKNLAAQQKAYEADTQLMVDKAQKELQNADDVGAAIEKINQLKFERSCLWFSKEADAQKIITQTQLTGYGQMLGDASNMFQSFYEASGKKNKELFFMMKALALAETMVTGIAASMDAFDKGQELTGTPMGGMIWSGIVMAMTAAKCSMIASQMFAEGGPVLGGSGTRDDVLIAAMGGEYVQNKAAVGYYGVDVMEAINQRLIPRDAFSVPSIPTSRPGSHFASGGLVTNVNNESSQSAPSIHIANFVDPALMGQYLASQPGKRALVNFINGNSAVIKAILR
jgi:hypothetical protein